MHLVLRSLKSKPSSVTYQKKKTIHMKNLFLDPCCMFFGFCCFFFCFLFFFCFFFLVIFFFCFSCFGCRLIQTRAPRWFEIVWMLLVGSHGVVTATCSGLAIHQGTSAAMNFQGIYSDCVVIIGGLLFCIIFCRIVLQLNKVIKMQKRDRKHSDQDTQSIEKLNGARNQMIFIILCLLILCCFAS